jgi:ribulose-5-phosphate 4-epimerase/fuculose-1-phosphate aldolase
MDMVSDLAAIAELQDQLLVWERELDHREKLLLIWEHGMVAVERSLGRAHMEYDVAHDQTRAVQQD